MKIKYYLLQLLFFFLYMMLFSHCSSPYLHQKINQKVTFPEVIYSSIPDNSVDIPQDTTLTIRFSEPMNKQSVNKSSMLLTGGEEPVDCSYSWNAGKTSFTLTPGLLLERDRFYLFKITDDAESETGFNLVEEYTLPFTTSHEDNIHPTIVGTVPAAQTTTFKGDQDIVITFSEQMNTTVTESAFTLTDINGDVVTGTFSWSGNEMQFKPEHELMAFGEYTITVTDTAADIAGKRLREGVHIPFKMYGKVKLIRAIGEDDSYLYLPFDIAVYEDGTDDTKKYCFVLDSKSNRVVKYSYNDSTGNFNFGGTWEFREKTSSEPSYLSAIAVDSDGSVYVAIQRELMDIFYVANCGGFRWICLCGGRQLSPGSKIFFR